MPLVMTWTIGKENCRHLHYLTLQIILGIHYSKLIIMKTFIFSEILFKNGDRKLFREDLQCMLPGKEIDPQILELVAYNTTWMQTHSSKITTWSLPVSFSVSKQPHTPPSSHPFHSLYESKIVILDGLF